MEGNESCDIQRVNDVMMVRNHAKKTKKKKTSVS